ncbi:hypothetical protein NHF46_18795 [Arthrobacter alpinus]|nr:hypothetical protein [Arthrobacter alpinus]
MTNNSIPSVGLVGWRGMVGSVLVQRMQDEGDFGDINPVFFSTSNAGGNASAITGGDTGKLEDAFDIDTLAKLPIIVTAQGGDYTSVYTPSCATAAGTASGWTRPPRCA